MKAFKDIEVRIMIQLTKFEAEWLCRYLRNYPYFNPEDESVEDKDIRSEFLCTLAEALDLPENN